MTSTTVFRPRPQREGRWRRNAEEPQRNASALESILILGVILLVVHVLTRTLSNDVGSMPSTLFQLAWMTNVVIVAQSVVLRRTLGTYTSPLVLFSILLALFTTGQLTLYSFGIEPEGADVLNRENWTYVKAATVFFLHAYLCFGIGTLLAARRDRPAREPRRPHPSREDWQGGLLAVGGIALVLSAVPFALSTFNTLRVVWTSGYSNYYREGARVETPFAGLSYLFITGLVFLGCSANRNARRFALTTLVLIALLRLAGGDRGEGMIYFLTAFLLHTQVRDTTKQVRAQPLIIGGVAILAIPWIGSLRQSFGAGGGGVAPSLLEDNPIVATLQTLGATLFPLVKVVELVPLSQSHIMGSSYLAGPLRLIPGPLQIGFVKELTQDPVSASPANWLMKTLDMTYGPGFTPFAEGYLNFGFWGGCLALLCFGFAYGKLLSLPVWASRVGPFRSALALSSFALVGFSVRGSFNIAVPFVTRYTVLPLVLAMIAAHTIRRRRLARADG